MPKGYIIARIDITNSDEYRIYAEMASVQLEKHNGRILARGGRHEAMDGPARSRNVVIEFDSFEKAHAYYNSPGYQAARECRVRAGIGEVVLVEGL